MKETIFLVCGVEYGGKTTIANTRFQGGNDFHYYKETISIYAQPLRILSFDDITLSVLSKIKEKYTKSCDFVSWDYSWNRAPNFSIDLELTKHICFILNCLCSNYVFSVGDFDPTDSKLVFEKGFSVGKRIYEIDKCIKIL